MNRKLAALAVTAAVAATSAWSWTKQSSTMNSTFYQSASGNIRISIGCYPRANSVDFTLVSPTPFLDGPTQQRRIDFVMERTGDNARRYSTMGDYLFGPEESWIGGKLPFAGDFEPFASASQMTIRDLSGATPKTVASFDMTGSAAAIAAVLKTCPQRP